MSKLKTKKEESMENPISCNLARIYSLVISIVRCQDNKRRKLQRSWKKQLHPSNSSNSPSKCNLVTWLGRTRIREIERERERKAL